MNCCSNLCMSLNVQKRKDGLDYHCEPMHMFELGSVHYDHYLLNVRLPSFNDEPINAEIGKIVDLNMAVSSAQTMRKLKSNIIEFGNWLT